MRIFSLRFVPDGASEVHSSLASVCILVYSLLGQKVAGPTARFFCISDFLARRAPRTHGEQPPPRELALPFALGRFENYAPGRGVACGLEGPSIDHLKGKH